MLWCQFWSVITTFYMVFTVGSNFTIVSTTITFVHILFLWIKGFVMITWTFPDCLYTCICSYFVIKYSNKHLYCERIFFWPFDYFLTTILFSNWQLKKNWNRSKLLLTAFYPMNQNIIRNVRGFLKVKLFN